MRLNSFFYIIKRLNSWNTPIICAFDFPVRFSYNPYFSVFIFQQEQCFSLTTNQSEQCFAFFFSAKRIGPLWLLFRVEYRNTSWQPCLHVLVIVTSIDKIELVDDRTVSCLVYHCANKTPPCFKTVLDLIIKCRKRLVL